MKKIFSTYLFKNCLQINKKITNLLKTQSKTRKSNSEENKFKYSNMKKYSIVTNFGFNQRDTKQ